jgi:peptide/nickel transport system substrate-binding protein
MQHLVNQADSDAGDLRRVEVLAEMRRYFACGTPMENDANNGVVQARPDLAKAKELFKKAGYDGRPVVILQATDTTSPIRPACSWRNGCARPASTSTSPRCDWGAVLTRRAVKKPPAEGGWNIFSTTATARRSRTRSTSPATRERRQGLVRLADERPPGEAARRCVAAAEALDDQEAPRRELQANAWDYVHHLYLGQFFRGSAWRKTVTGVIGIARDRAVLGTWRRRANPSPLRGGRIGRSPSGWGSRL